MYCADFKGDEELIVEKCQTAGLQYIVVNGLEPKSNREVLALSERHCSLYLPAIGIYPLDAACNVITNWPHEFPQVVPTPVSVSRLHCHAMPPPIAMPSLPIHDMIPHPISHPFPPPPLTSYFQHSRPSLTWMRRSPSSTRWLQSGGWWP